MVSARDLSGAFGFTCMLGGTLFGLLVVLLAVLSDVTTIGLAVGSSMLMFALFFLIPGTVGLYVAHRPVLSWPGTAAAALLVGGLLSFLLAGLLGLAEVAVADVVVVELVATGLLVAGALAFGTAVAYHDVLLHGRLGGVLLAAALPFGFAARRVLGLLDVRAPVVAALLFAVPFSLAWLLLGLDLLTVDAGSVDLTVIRQPE